MKKILPLLYLTIFATLTGVSQQTLYIKGSVFEANSKKPISFAAICISGKPIGTVSNDTGDFSFHFPADYKNDTLTISSLGFKSYKHPIAKILRDSVTLFYLDTTSIPIKPIVVLSKGETAKQIVEKAAKKIRKNYPTKMYYLNAFYRELCMRDNKYARLIEAAVNIQDFGYDTDLNTTRLRINEIRKSDSYLEYDLKSKIYGAFFGSNNLLLNAYSSDFVRAKQNNCRNRNFLCMENIDRHAFTLEECKYIDNKLIYIISYKDTLGDGKNTKQSSNIGGSIHIQADNYAIVKFDWGIYAVNNSKQGVDYYFNNKYFYYYSVRYREFEGKYYPDLIQNIEPVNGAFKTNSSDTIQGKQYVTSTLMINTILTKRREFAKIKNKEKEIPTEDIYKKKFPYNPSFWKNYNIILLNPLMESINNDLQKDKPLEEQFKNNGE